MSQTAILRISFNILSALFDSGLYTNVSDNVQYMEICFYDCNIKKPIPENATAYNLKLVFPDNTGGHTGWINISYINS